MELPTMQVKQDLGVGRELSWTRLGKAMTTGTPAMLALRLLPMYRASAAKVRFAKAPGKTLRNSATAAACS
jgi:hypothetical protein